jgi:hypothetical protein
MGPPGSPSKRKPLEIYDNRRVRYCGPVFWLSKTVRNSGPYDCDLMGGESRFEYGCTDARSRLSWSQMASDAGLDRSSPGEGKHDDEYAH